MPVQTRSQTQQYGHTLPSNYEYPLVINTHSKMEGETNKSHATEETEKLIEKALAQQQTEMFAQFNEILMRIT